MRWVLAVLVVFPASALADDPPKAIKPEEALRKVNQDVVVEMKVQSSRLLDSGICYLNSKKDHRDAENFTIFLPKGTVDKLKSTSKIDDPATHFKGKTILVTGKVTKFKGKSQIKVDDPKSVKVKEDGNKKDDSSESVMSRIGQRNWPATWFDVRLIPEYD